MKRDQRYLRLDIPMEEKCNGCGEMVEPDDHKPDHYYCECGFMWVAEPTPTTEG